MKKIILITCMIFITIPIALHGQFDSFFMMEDILLGETGPDINLQNLELYWSTDSYVPFGYQGRPLPAKGSLVTVEADLKISGENPKNLKYSWFLDDIFQESKSGYGRDGFQFYIRRFSGASHTVLVKIFNESRSFYVERSITIPIIEPEIVVYSKGDSISAKSFNIIADKETSFLALPYFFNIKSLGDLEFEWTLGDKSVKESSQVANIFGLKIINKQVEESLEEILRVFVTNKKQTDQRVQKIIKINIY